jgi:hypothetical protein
VATTVSAQFRVCTEPRRESAHRLQGRKGVSKKKCGDIDIVFDTVGGDDTPVAVGILEAGG